MKQLVLHHRCPVKRCCAICNICKVKDLKPRRYQQLREIAPGEKIALCTTPIFRLFHPPIISWANPVNLVLIFGKAHERGGTQRSEPEKESYLLAPPPPPPDLVLPPWPPPSTLHPLQPEPAIWNPLSKPVGSFLIIKRRRSPTFPPSD